MVAAVRVDATDLPEAQARAALDPHDPSGAFILEHQAQAQELMDQGGLPVLQPLKLEAVGPGFARFRTRPGRRRTQINVRVYQDHPVAEVNVRLKNAWERAMKNAHGPDWKKALEPDQKIFKHTGGQTSFKFEPIGLASEAQYVTDDSVVAAYLRYRMPDFPHIYEDIQPVWVEVNGELVEMEPKTIEGKQKVAQMQAGQR